MEARVPICLGIIGCVPLLFLPPTPGVAPLGLQSLVLQPTRKIKGKKPAKPTEKSSLT